MSVPQSGPALTPRDWSILRDLWLFRYLSTQQIACAIRGWMAFLAHHSLVTDFRIWLREACTHRGFSYQFINLLSN